MTTSQSSGLSSKIVFLPFVLPTALVMSLVWSYGLPGLNVSFVCTGAWLVVMASISAITTNHTPRNRRTHLHCARREARERRRGDMEAWCEAMSYHTSIPPTMRSMLLVVQLLPQEGSSVLTSHRSTTRRLIYLVPRRWATKRSALCPTPALLQDKRFVTFNDRSCCATRTVCGNALMPVLDFEVACLRLCGMPPSKWHASVCVACTEDKAAPPEA